MNLNFFIARIVSIVTHACDRDLDLNKENFNSPSSAFLLISRAQFLFVSF